MASSDLRAKGLNYSDTASNTKTTPRFEKTRVNVGQHELSDLQDEDIIDTEEEKGYCYES